LLGGDQGTCLKHGSADVLEPPERRHALALGLCSDQRVHNRPKRGHVLLIDPGIECLTLWRLSRGIHDALQDVSGGGCDHTCRRAIAQPPSTGSWLLTHPEASLM